MKRLIPIGLSVMLVGVVLLGWAGYSDIDTEHGAQNLARLTDRMKTHCIGRFLIDMPAEAQVELGPTTVEGFSIVAFLETTEEFQKRLADREAEIRAKPDRLGGSKNLESQKQVKSDNGIVGKIFVHSRTVNEGTAANGLELERYRYEGVALEALVHGAGVSINLGTDYYDPGQVWRLAQLVSQLVPNPDNSIPAAPGFCFDRAYFQDPLTADQGEQITMFGEIPKHPDVDFMLSLAAGLKPDSQGLLERSSASEGKLPLWVRWRISKLRAAPRDIAGLRGDEMVRRVIEGNDAHVYRLRWDVNGTEDNVLIPRFLFKMDTGKSNRGPVPTSLSEADLLALWDRILSSIRLRQATQTHRGTVPSVPVAAR